MTTLFENIGCGIHPDTPILLATGDIKLAKEIKPGDLLIGDNGLCKRVVSTYTGEDDMFQIVPIKGTAFICSKLFKLTLKSTTPCIRFRNDRVNKYAVKYPQGGHVKSKAFGSEDEARSFMATLPESDIVDISVVQYLRTNKSFKARTYLYHVGIHFNASNIPFDPYMIGY